MSLMIHRLCIAATAVLLLGVALGAGSLAAGRPSVLGVARSGDLATTQAAPRAERPPDEPGPGRMFVVGRVLSPEGRPVPNATAMAYARSKALGHSPSLSRMSAIPIGEARADGSGGFRLDLPRTSSSRYDEFGVVAIAPGYGAAWADLDPDAERPDAVITLRPGQVIRGRFLDLQGRPAAGVTVGVSLMGRVAGKQSPAAPRETFEDVLSFWWAAGNGGLAGWPRPAITDADGWFSLDGIGRGLRATLRVYDPRFAAQRISIDTDAGSHSRPLVWALEPAKVIRGRVTYADTGAPAAHALLTVTSSREGQSGSPVEEFQADEQGRFRISPMSADHYTVTAWPPAAAVPYLTARQSFDWSKGAVDHALELSLTRGVLIRGRVTEEGSGKPVSGATIRFVSHEARNGTMGRGSTVLDTASDGTFQFGALPSPGYLSVMGPSDDYVLREIGELRVNEGRPGGRRFYAHAQIRLDPRPGTEPTEVAVSLRRGETVTGEVIGPDGQSVREAWMFGRVLLEPTPGLWRMWSGSYHGLARKGYFEVHGLDRDAEVPIAFLEPGRKLGATVILSGKAADGPITVRLEPLGAARARLVGPGGQPVVGWHVLQPFLTMAVTPGAASRRGADAAGLLSADEAPLTVIDPINHIDPVVSDDQGRVTFAALIPGATYRFIDRTTIRTPSGPQIRKEFTVKPAETIDLGDILIEKPN